MDTTGKPIFQEHVFGTPEYCPYGKMIKYNKKSQQKGEKAMLEGFVAGLILWTGPAIIAWTVLAITRVRRVRH
jgi:hypothetical protein